MDRPADDSYVHHALFYGADEQLVAAAWPFLSAGLAADEVTVLACTDRKNELLFDALGRDPRIIQLRPVDIYTRVPAAIVTYQQLVRTQVADGAHRVRLVGELDFGPDPASWAEWGRFEAMVNIAFSAYPLSSVCAYDTRAVPKAAVMAGYATHPHLLTEAGRVSNDRYVEPVRYLRGLPAADDEIGRPPPTVRFPDLFEADDLGDLRRRLRSELVGAPSPVRSDFLAAVAEVASNALRHGRPPVQVRLWVGPEQLACSVTDRGPGFDDPLAGYLPVRGDELEQPGVGLALARQLCDRIGTARKADGFTVWLTTALPPSSGTTGPAAGAS